MDKPPCFRFTQCATRGMDCSTAQRDWHSQGGRTRWRGHDDADNASDSAQCTYWSGGAVPEALGPVTDDNGPALPYKCRPAPKLGTYCARIWKSVGCVNVGLFNAKPGSGMGSKEGAERQRRRRRRQGNVTTIPWKSLSCPAKPCLIPHDGNWLGLV